MWYTARNKEDKLNSNYIDYQMVNKENGTANFHVFSLTTGPLDPLGQWTCLGNFFSISFFNNRVLPHNSENSCITKQYVKSDILISVPNGDVNVEGFQYQNDVFIDHHREDKLTLNVSSGNGIFEDAKIVHITIDNDGSLFGQKWGRRVEVFKLKPKQTEDIPPDFSGIFNREIFLYGYLSKDIKIPIEQPLKFDQTVEVKQVGNFIEIRPLTYPPGFPERPDLPGVLEATYDENLKFTGWKVITVNTNNNNATFSIAPTKIINNIVIEFTEINYQSGFQENNIEQSPLVGYSINKRVYS